MSTIVETSFLSSENEQPIPGVSLQISTPGKIILFGEHSVVYHKVAVAASVDLRTKLLLDEKDSLNNQLSVKLSKLQLDVQIDLKVYKALLLSQSPEFIGDKSTFNWFSPEGLRHEILLEKVKKFCESLDFYQDFSNPKKLALTSVLYLLTAMISSVNIDLKSVEISAETDLILGAGTGSSASFNVATAALILQYLKIKFNNQFQKGNNISRCGFKEYRIKERFNLKTFTNEELEVISKWAFSGEKIIHGTPSGIDNTICTFGSLVQFQKGTTPKLLKMKNDFKLLLIYTKVQRNTKQLVQKVADLKVKYPSVFEPILDSMHNISESGIECIKKIDELGTDSDSKEVAAEYEKLAELSRINHGLLKILGVSHPTLDEIINILEKYGLTAKLTGAGGGGYAICIIPPTVDQNTIDEVIKKLTDMGYDALVTTVGGRGVRIEES